ncbi:hypothetical protein BKA70DRAFT_1223655 [Coprinopsis sp. MPI-PUGE-AT-0042]|nr:hypothetical protein BKA70DRAFT_1223655 [Coprinopsis sp. MPI-PUGE-AT-0042]
MLSKLFYATLAIYLTTPVAAAPGTLTTRQASGPIECSLGFSPHCCDEVKQLPFNADVVVLDVGAGMGCTPVSIDDECERQTACCVSVDCYEVLHKLLGMVLAIEQPLSAHIKAELESGSSPNFGRRVSWSLRLTMDRSFVP